MLGVPSKKDTHVRHAIVAQPTRPVRGEEQHGLPCTLHTFGFGSDLDSELLDQLAAAAGGVAWPWRVGGGFWSLETHLAGCVLCEGAPKLVVVLSVFTQRGVPPPQKQKRPAAPCIWKLQVASL